MLTGGNVVFSDQIYSMVHSFSVNQEGCTGNHTLSKTSDDSIVPGSTISKVVSIDNEVFH